MSGADQAGNGRAQRREKRRQRLYESPVRVVVVLASAIFVAEALVMLVFRSMPGVPWFIDLLADSSILLLLLTPIFRIYIYKPMKAQIEKRKAAEACLKEYQAGLESIIEDRTAKLVEALQGLERENAERMLTEEALQRSEERFRLLFEQTEDAIILFKPGTCRIIDVNSVAERLYGYSKQELFSLGAGCLMGSEDYAKFCEIIGQVRHGDTIRIDSVTHIRKGGEEIVASVRGKMVSIQNVDLVYCTMRNITQRIRLEEEARLIQAKLIHTNKMTSLGVLVASIAHEINNPNNYIMTNSELLAKVCRDIHPILQEYYDEYGDFNLGGIPFSEMKSVLPELNNGISDGARRIRDIINNLKDFAREEASCVSTKVDVNRVVSIAASLLNHQIKKHTKHFRLNLWGAVPAVLGSTQQLEQVVINLIMNSLQALPGEECSVEVSTLFAADKDEVVIRVTDEGGGIPADIANRILEPFFTTRLDSGGSGLGLAICHSIVREHRGTLGFESVPGRGTTFTVRLPAVH